ncbi:MAG: hypothetical protein K6B17_06900 [Treponema sp.]|nr:hypothetical protein [Treponema sp.]
MNKINLYDLTLREMFAYIKNGEKGLQEILDEYPIGYISHRKDGVYKKKGKGSEGWVKLSDSENEFQQYLSGSYFVVKNDIPVKINGTYDDGWILKKGEEVTDIQHFTKGAKIRVVNYFRSVLESRYGIKTKVDDWTKSKGLCFITNGEKVRFVELHWYDVKNYGRFEIKEKFEE